jgi:alpha-tubulin suppressor-like RCC1 family protein
MWGELGDGTFEPRNTAVPAVGVPAGVVTLSSGAFHTCARTASGEVWCWGLDDVGQLGDGSATYGGPTPVPVAGVPEIAAISAGAFHTCALTSSGAIRCWGANEGRLGNGSLLNSDVPVGVIGFEGTPEVPALEAPWLLFLAATFLAVDARRRRRRDARPSRAPSTGGWRRA